ncbi:MAG: hypothetical protein ACR2M8_01340 [Pyrinomonadaceae bacterium]
MHRMFLKPGLLMFTAIFSSAAFNGCTVAASKTPRGSIDANKTADSALQGAAIRIETNSPADTVRVFYKNLREKRFREAIFLTNLRPAVEGLTDAELKEFQVDFEAIAKNVPVNLEINGEIVSGNSATVTAKMPGEDVEKTEIQAINLRRENGVWIILTVDEKVENVIKQEGKNYFYALRIETHHDEAKEMLERIAKAQIAYSAQNQGDYAPMPALIVAGLLPADIKSADSTGYVYAINLSKHKREYFATATPAVYGKSGKLSFILELKGKQLPTARSVDNGGKPLKK